MTKISLLIVAACIYGQKAPPDAEKYWGQWRGPLANGVAPKANPPTKWDSDTNIRWKVRLDGQGQSTPIVWGDRVYIQLARPAGDKAPDNAARTDETQAGKGPADFQSMQPEGRRRGREGGRRRGGRPGMAQRLTQEFDFVVAAFDRKNGKAVWEKTVRTEVPHEGSHNDGSMAPNSPLTDGRRLYAYFGSRGLYCMDMDGKVLWEKDLGDMRTRNGFGEGSSPALFGDTLIITWDHEGDSFIVALDAKTGDEKWRRDRDEPTSWATPFIAADGGAPQIIVPGSNRVRGYDIESGDVRWECAGLGTNCIPTATTGFGLAFVMSGHRNEALLAIRYKKAKGDITDSDNIAWRLSSGTPYVPSPLLYEGDLYLVQKNTNILSCFDARTGEPQYERERLDKIDGIYSSPVAAKDRIYIAGRNGTTYVLKAGPEFKVLSINELDDDFSASPAPVGKELYLRGKNFLYCIAE